jgi:hypothetical protein
MAFATETYEYARQKGGPVVDPNDPTLRFFHFSYVHSAGAGVGVVDLLRLPPGRWQLVPAKSRVQTNAAFVATSDLHVGVRACAYQRHPDRSLELLAEDPNALADNLDAGGGAIDTALGWDQAAYPGVTEPRLFNPAGINIFATVDTANIADTRQINGWIAARPW